MNEKQENGTEEATNSSNETQSNEAIDFFKYLAGDACPISPKQLLDLVRYVYEKACDGEKITKIEPTHMLAFINGNDLQEDPIMDWFWKEHGIVGDGQIFDNWVAAYFGWLQWHPQFYRVTASLPDLLLGENGEPDSQ